MANMSYCRFRNTAIALADCVYTLEDILDGVKEHISVEEHNASERMYELCREYIKLFEDINGDKL